MTSLRYGRITPRRLVGALRRRVRWRIEAVRPVPAEQLPPFPVLPDTPVRLGIGPANFAGQGWEWKRAVEAYLDGVSAEVFAVQTSGLNFPADHPIEGRWYRTRAWQDRQEQRVLYEYTHLLAEAVRPVIGVKYGDTLGAELPVLAAAPVQVAVLLHGSEIRRPDRHAERHAHSPFHDRDWELARVLQDQSERLGRIVVEFDGPLFVSTPDLLDDVPAATWLPVVVDPSVWRSDHPVLERARPVVVHVPSNARMKGSERIDPVAQRLADEGLIDYRRLEGLRPAEMPAVVADADIVLDQFALGSYGVAAVQAMAAGRVTVGHVADHVRARIPVDLPIVDATPDTLREVLLGLLADRAAARAVAAAGQRYAHEQHDGRRSAAVLSAFLGRSMVG